MTARGVVKRTTRYTLVGVLCAATYNAVMIFGSKVGANYISLIVLSYFIVTPIGYLLHARFTFGVSRSWRDFSRFASAVAASFPIVFIVMVVLVSGLHLAISVAAPTATGIMYLWNYASSHWALRVPLFGKKWRPTNAPASCEKDIT